MHSELVEKAIQFARAAHGSINHKRKYTGEDYSVHLAEVADIVRSVAHSDEMLCAAWLHDTVEDTPITLADIEREFGEKVATMVEQLTDVSRPEDGNRQVRKALDRAHTAQAWPEVKTIKLADIISNVRSIVQQDPGYAPKYLREKELLLEVLKEGDSVLWQQAAKLVADSWQQLRRQQYSGRTSGKVAGNR